VPYVRQGQGEIPDTPAQVVTICQPMMCVLKSSDRGQRVHNSSIVAGQLMSGYPDKGRQSPFSHNPATNPFSKLGIDLNTRGFWYMVGALAAVAVLLLVVTCCTVAWCRSQRELRRMRSLLDPGKRAGVGGVGGAGNGVVSSSSAHEREPLLRRQPPSPPPPPCHPQRWQQHRARAGPSLPGDGGHAWRLGSNGGGVGATVSVGAGGLAVPAHGAQAVRAPLPLPVPTAAAAHHDGTVSSSVSSSVEEGERGPVWVTPPLAPVGAQAPMVHTAGPGGGGQLPVLPLLLEGQCVPRTVGEGQGGGLLLRLSSPLPSDGGGGGGGGGSALPVVQAVEAGGVFGPSYSPAGEECV
jgi:hypothetical protein